MKTAINIFMAKKKKEGKNVYKKQCMAALHETILLPLDYVDIIYRNVFINACHKEQDIFSIIRLSYLVIYNSFTVIVRDIIRAEKENVLHVKGDEKTPVYGAIFNVALLMSYYKKVCTSSVNTPIVHIHAIVKHILTEVSIHLYLNNNINILKYNNTKCKFLLHKFETYNIDEVDTSLFDDLTENLKELQNIILSKKEMLDEMKHTEENTFDSRMSSIRDTVYSTLTMYTKEKNSKESDTESSKSIYVKLRYSALSNSYASIISYFIELTRHIHNNIRLSNTPNNMLRIICTLSTLKLSFSYNIMKFMASDSSAPIQIYTLFDVIGEHMFEIISKPAYQKLRRYIIRRLLEHSNIMYCMCINNPYCSLFDHGYSGYLSGIISRKNFEQLYCKKSYDECTCINAPTFLFTTADDVQKVSMIIGV